MFELRKVSVPFQTWNKWPRLQFHPWHSPSAHGDVSRVSAAEISFELQWHVTVKLTSLCSRELHVQLFPAPLGDHMMDSVGRAVPDVRVLYVCSGVTWPSGTHPLKKPKSSTRCFNPLALFECLHTHTERSRKEEDQGHMAAHSGTAGLNALPYFTETSGDCCHPLFPMWAPVAWLQEPGEDFSPVTHCLAAANTISVFLWDTGGLLTAPHGMSHTSSSILGDATSCMED